MKTKMITVTILLLIGFTISLSVFAATDIAALEAVTITLGVAFYHFAMRLAVGTVVDRIMKNKANHESLWFREKAFEKRLYRLLRVQSWKKHIPTYDPDTFDAGRKTVAEIVGATCQAEIVHEVIMALSLLPIALIPLLGGAAALIVTSLLSLLIDSVFVILQRYNRPKLVRVMERLERRTKGSFPICKNEKEL